MLRLIPQKVISIIYPVGITIFVINFVYNAIIFNPSITQWVLGILFTLILILLAIILPFWHDEEIGLISLIQLIVAAIVYISWFFLHISANLKLGYFAFLILLLVLVTTFTAGMVLYTGRNKKNNIFIFPAWIFCLLGIGAIFGMIWKYFFIQAEFSFLSFIGEIFIIIVAMFIMIFSVIIADIVLKNVTKNQTN